MQPYSDRRNGLICIVVCHRQLAFDRSFLRRIDSYALSSLLGALHPIPLGRSGIIQRFSDKEIRWWFCVIVLIILYTVESLFSSKDSTGPFEVLKEILVGYYPKEIILKDGTGVSLRPLRQGDAGLLVEMFYRFSDEDRWFIEGDVTDLEWTETWLKRMEKDKMMSVVAVLEEQIIGCGTLIRGATGPEHHIGKVRVSVVPIFREKNLATWMLLDLINMAMTAEIEALVMPLVEDRDSSLIRSIMKLDFSKEAVLKDYVKDWAGTSYNLALMIKRVHRSWGP